MAVTVIFANATDADVSSTNATYATARNGGTLATPAGTVNELHEGQLFFGNYFCYQSFIDFDLTGIPAGQTVTSAIMQTWLLVDNTGVDFNCIAVGYDWGASVTTADWRNAAFWAGQTWWTTLNTATMGATGAYKSWSDTTDIRALLTLLAGTEVNFVLSSDLLAGGVAPVGGQFVVWANATTAGTTNDPKITITHSQTLLATTPQGGVVVGGETPYEFISPTDGNTVDSDIAIEWDFDNDGDFSESIEDITDYVIAAETLTGRDYPSSLTGQAGPGQLKLTLLNNDDRFSYFNSSSPLTTSPNSLRTGRKIRVRTSSTVNTPPVLLARDRFNRANFGALGFAETGQAWVDETAAQLDLISNTAQQPSTAAGFANTTINVGATDMYVQARLSNIKGPNQAGVIARWTDINNFSYVTLSSTGMQVRDVNAGVDSQIGPTYPFVPYDGVTVGCVVAGTTILGFVDGVPVTGGTLPGAINGFSAGLVSFWFQYSAPRIDEFYVYNKVNQKVNGIIWTGDVTDVKVNVKVGDTKLAEVTAEGPLARMASLDVEPPRSIGGEETGHLLGNVLSSAGLLHPPHYPNSQGTIVTGAVALNPGNALDLARKFEEAEQGFIFESNEGAVGFYDQTERLTASSTAWFTDTPGVGQYPFHRIEPYDQKTQIVNRVTAGVAADVPSGITQTTRTSNTAIFTPNPVTVLMPATVNAGDLLVVFIASTVAASGEEWNVPIWWTEHRNAKSDIRVRVYSHFCDGTEDGTNVTFYNDTAGIGGAWVAHIYRIENWYESTVGIEMVPFIPGKTAAPLAHSWGRAPTLFIAAHGALTSSTGGGLGTLGAPDGYGPTATSNFLNGANDGADVLLATAYKTDIVDAETSGAWSGPTGFLIEESTVFAVRGYNGPHTLATLANPQTTGGTGEFVTVDDLDSQDEHNVIRAHVTSSNLSENVTAATIYANSVLDKFSDDRPIIQLSFWATSSDAHREQAIARRVGDLVTVTANGSTGLGVEGNFFIEAISHRWSSAGKQWETTWHLSPE